MLISLILPKIIDSNLLVKAENDNCSNPSSLNLDAIGRCLEDIKKAYELSVKATQPLESQLTSMQTQIAGIKARVSSIENEIAVKKANIDEGYKNLEEKKTIFDKTVNKNYIESYNNNWLSYFVGSRATDIIQNLAYQKAKADQDKVIITNIALSIQDLETKKTNLENEQNRLVILKADLDDQSTKLDKIVSGAKMYQSTLSGQIAALSAKQEEILNAKSGTFTTSVGDVPLADDPNASPSYNPGFSPAFAAFSFGAFTHRNGMSQYGAKALADSKNYKEIIDWYYGHGVKRDDGMSSTINVQGYGEMDFQRYLYGIAEMPSSWPMEALKAQAVAARSYANRAGKPICTTEACQVFSKSKSDNPPDQWKKAVDETDREIIDGDVSSQYSSTTGGWINTNGGFWDTKCRSKDCWTSDAYEKIAGSPWFYKGWYTQSYSISSNKCDRSSPWLSSEEMSDILNTYLIQNKSGVDNGRITPTTTSCWGGNPYSIGEVRDLAGNVGGGSVNSISNISVVYNNDGKTASITFSTNRGDISIAGSDFKQIFNLRAPGYISIKSVLFNIEKK